jgi:hypothetical protein
MALDLAESTQVVVGRPMFPSEAGAGASAAGADLSWLVKHEEEFTQGVQVAVAEQDKLREASTVAKRLKNLQDRGLVQPGPERQCTAGGDPSREWHVVE